MKKTILSVLTLSLCSMSSLFAGEVSELYTHSIVKTSLEEGTFDLVGATVFSTEDVDGEESTGYYSFKLSDIKTYPSTVSISMSSAYTEADNTNFNGGGTAAAPRYAITNNAKNIDLEKKTSASVNRLFFLSPAKNATCFKMSNIHHAAGKKIKVKFSFLDYTLRYISEEVSDKVKYQIKAGQAGSTSNVYEFTVDWDNADKDVDAEFSLQDAGVADFDIELVRVSDYGNEHVCYIQDFYVYSDAGASEILTASALNAVAYYGTEATIMADFKSPVTESALVWEESEDGTTFTEISSFSGQQNITVNPEIGKHFYRVKATASGTEYKSNIILTTRTMGCAASSKILWREDFGTLTPETARNSNQYVKSTYSYAASGNVNDGQYAVVANPRTAGSDGGTSESSYWFRDIYDHTQGQPVNNDYGGMLLVNCRAGQQTNDIVMERTVELECKNAFVNFSAWFANAGWDRGTGSNLPINMKICVFNPSNQVLAEINVEAEKSEGWKSGLVSFYNKDWDKLTLRIINNGEGGGGNDVLIDDIEFTICRPDVTLEVQVGGQTVDDITDVRAACGGDVLLIADPNGSYSSLYSIANPYYRWLKSIDKSTWTDAGQAGTGETKQKFTVQASTTRTYYKCIIGPDMAAVDAYVQNPTAYSCSSVAEASYASVRCPANVFVSVYKVGCNKYKLTFDPAPNSVKWYIGSDDCGWKLLSGVTEATDFYTLISNDIPAGSCKLYFKGVDGSDNTRWAVSSDYVEYSELTLSSKLNVDETIGCDIVYDLTAEMKKNGVTEKADEYSFQKSDGSVIQATSSPKCQLKKSKGYDTGMYRVVSDQCTDNATVDMTCPQLNFTNVCNQYTFTLTGDDGSNEITWYYGNGQIWTKIAGESNATLSVADIHTLFPKGTEGSFYVGASISQGTKAVALDMPDVQVEVNVYDLKLKADLLRDYECKKTFTLKADLKINYKDGGGTFTFYENNNPVALYGPTTDKICGSTPAIDSDTTFYVTTDAGCYADTLVRAGCLKLTVTKIECNKYEFKVTGSKGGAIKWEYGNGQIWKEIPGASGTTFTVDITTLFDASSPELKVIKVSEGTVEEQTYMEDQTYVSILNLTFTATPSIIENCGGNALLKANINVDGQGLPFYEFYIKGDATAIKSGLQDTCTTPYISSETTFTVKATVPSDRMCEKDVTVKVNCPPEPTERFCWPTVFMPDGTQADNVSCQGNQYFCPFHYYSVDELDCRYVVCNEVVIPESMKIFDRTGNMVADLKHKAWNGATGDNMVMPGVYFYVAVVNGETYKGTVEVYKELKANK